MNNIILKVIMLFNPLWKRSGVDTDQLKEILRVKLLIDDRRPSGLKVSRRQQKKAQNRSTITTMIVSLVMGCVYLVVFWIPADLLLQLTVYFFMFMVLLAISLISDFTYVLIDSKDNYIILPRPVNDRTFLVSRLLHIFIHASKIIIPMVIPGFIYLVVTYQFAGLLFIPLIFLNTLLTVFTVNAVYLLILKITSPERFKEIINYVQILFSILIFAIYYLVPQLLSRVLEHVNILHHQIFYFTPPLWFAALWQMCTHPEHNKLLLIFSILAVVVPLLSIILVVKYLAPAFNRKIAMISGSGTEVSKKKRVLTSGKGFSKRLAGIFTKGFYEKAGFELVWMITGRSRDFKLKVYPGFAYVIIYFFYIGLNGSGTLQQKWDRIGVSKMYIVLIYLSSFAMVFAIRQSMYSDKFKAAWIYYSTPLKQPGELLVGAFKALMVKFYLPFFIIICAFVLWVWHWRVWPDLLLGFINVCLIGIMLCYISLRQMPFSAAQDIQRNTGNFLKNLFYMIMPMILMGVHYFISGMIWAELLVLILAFILLWMMISKYREMNWASLKITA